MTKLKRGAQVLVHKQYGIVIDEYINNMYEVRIMDGCRHVGVVVVPFDDLTEVGQPDNGIDPIKEAN